MTPRAPLHAATDTLHPAPQITATIPVKTTNTLNAQLGNSRISGVIRARTRAAQRSTTVIVFGAALRASVVQVAALIPCTITLTRVAPSSGLDDDALPASMKALRDGIADVLGFTNDRHPSLEWRYAQRRGAKGQYAVEVVIERRAV